MQAATATAPASSSLPSPRPRPSCSYAPADFGCERCLQSVDAGCGAATAAPASAFDVRALARLEEL
eukprot:364293-Chlamydomonas_euryale.AAC.1